VCVCAVVRSVLLFALVQLCDPSCKCIQWVQELCEDDEEAFVKMIHQAWFAFYRRHVSQSQLLVKPYLSLTCKVETGQAQDKQSRDMSLRVPE
jgi:hypothetical protein